MNIVKRHLAWIIPCNSAITTILSVVLLAAILLSGPTTASAFTWGGGWQLVPGDGHTDLPLAATVFEGKLYLFATGVEGGMWYQTYDGVRWSGTYVEVFGGGLTDNAMSATVANDKLYLFCKGLDGDVWMNIKSYQGGWTGWQKLPPGGARTRVAPCAVTTGDGVVRVFAIGTDNKIYMNTRRPYVSDAFWSGFQLVPGSISTDVPLAAAWDISSNRLAVFAKLAGGTSICRSYFSPSNGSWTSWGGVPGGGATNAAVAAAWDDSPVDVTGVRIFVKGINYQGIYVNLLDGRGWSEVFNYGTTDVALAVTRYSSHLYLFAKGIQDKRIYFNVGD